MLRAASTGNEDKEFSMEIDFDKMQGLAPAVIQDAVTAELLMVGFMNSDALEATLRTGFVTFYSRTRKALWTKGETSGNRLEVVAAWTDCDRDTVLLRVRVLGEGKVCHTGSRSCFTEQLPLATALADEESQR
ncbi:MAG TPA: phosphoribosyl-AMP cyclohydrolase [Candidatus Deferrimicrobiaceae bacterium]|nr:phosphoribosyl-AMP cyclohydrolase [Candidatus Deferrimicrobiaceae bacterium]